ncbi:MAG: HigA family addiction module antidote protein [Pseudomonadota bacterium]|nr:addiction module antidote protein, HigA family [Pseudomonadota bacterium]QKK04238.1 MAG: HigA family addiction module antidote protein [Pseudomonadota bacterium]
MSTSTETFMPDYIITPGEILEETLEARGIKKKEFAERCGRTAKMISEIIAGKAAITPETALQFEKVLGVSARLWSNLEARYRLKLAEEVEHKDLEKHKEILGRFPVNSLVKFGFLDKESNPAEQLKKVLSFFGVASVDALSQWHNIQKAYYRASEKFDSNEFSVAAWLRCGQIQAEDIETKSYNADKFKSALKKIRELTREPIDSAFPQAQEICAEAGVALTIIPEFNGTRLSGAARWLTKEKALIQLSGRYKTEDSFWFTFFHEAGHILLHGKKELFIDMEPASSVINLEAEANSFSQNTLIPKAEWREFEMMCLNPDSEFIETFAAEQRIAPGIVLGRLLHENVIRYQSYQYKILSKLRVKLDEKRLFSLSSRNSAVN